MIKHVLLWSNLLPVRSCKPCFDLFYSRAIHCLTGICPACLSRSYFGAIYCLSGTCKPCFDVFLLSCNSLPGRYLPGMIKHVLLWSNFKHVLLWTWDIALFLGVVSWDLTRRMDMRCSARHSPRKRAHTAPNDRRPTQVPQALRKPARQNGLHQSTPHRGRTSPVHTPTHGKTPRAQGHTP